MHNNNQSINQL